MSSSDNKYVRAVSKELADWQTINGNARTYTEEELDWTKNSIKSPKEQIDEMFEPFIDFEVKWNIPQSIDVGSIDYEGTFSPRKTVLSRFGTKTLNKNFYSTVTISGKDKD